MNKSKTTNIAKQNHNELNQKNITLNLNKQNDLEQIYLLGKALGNKDCMTIFQIICEQSLSMSEIAKITGISISSVSNHIDTLNAAELIHVYYQPGLKGHVKICNRKTLGINLDFSTHIQKIKNKKVTYEMGVGMFTDCNVSAPCGMANSSYSYELDKPNKLFVPEKASAELFWFSSGYVTYKFPNDINNNEIIESLSFSLELCSETMYYREKYPSDITFIVNGIELFTWTSPGDFGGRRGKYSPANWSITSTQFGLLKTFRINSNGITLDNLLVNSNITINDLNLGNNDIITLTIKIKDDAIHKGGINIFGKNFGDYDQAIIMTMNIKENKNA